MQQQQPLLAIRGARKDFWLTRGLTRSRTLIRAVDGVDLDVFPEETIGLVGESGCGKTTLGRLILRLEAPTSGQFRYRDQEIRVSTGSERRRLVGEIQMIFQDPSSSLNPRQRIGELLGRPLLVNHLIPKALVGERVASLLTEVGLPPAMAARYPRQLSGGQQQRVVLARALSVEPSLLVADEPLSALDVSVQAQVLRLLERVRDQRRLSMLFVSHDLAVVRYLCDRVAVMYLGKIVETAATKTIFGGPRHPYTTALLSAVPSTRRKRERIVLTGEIPSAANVPPGCRFHPRCWKAQAICREVEPPLEKIDETEVACHFPN